MTKRKLPRPKTLAYRASTKRTTKPKKAVNVPTTPTSAPPASSTEERVRKGDAGAPFSLRNIEDTRRLLSASPEYMELGREDHYGLIDYVYAGFASAELYLEVGMLTNLATMAQGLVMAALDDDQVLSEEEFRHYVYSVARDIRERARAGAQLLDARYSGLKEAAKGGAS